MLAAVGTINSVSDRVLERSRTMLAAVSPKSRLGPGI